MIKQIKITYKPFNKKKKKFCDNLSIFKDILDKNFQKILISDEKITETPLNQSNDLNLISDIIHIQEVQKLQMEETIELIQTFECELNQKSLQKLAEIIDGWPLAARILIPYLKQLNLLNDQSIEELVLNKIDKTSITEYIEVLVSRLSESSQKLLGLISYFHHEMIPIQMLEFAMISNCSDDALWFNSIGELEHFYIVDLSLEFINVQKLIHSTLDKYDKTLDPIYLLDYINSKFDFNWSSLLDTTLGNYKLHAQCIISKYSKSNIPKALLTLKLALVYYK